MTTFRMDRLNKEFMRLIAEMLSRRIKDDSAAKAILTNVSVSRDLSHAKVYFTLLDERERGTVLKALTAMSGRIRGALGREMHIRQIPELHFLYDDSEKIARSMDELIDSVMKGQHLSE